MLFPGSLGLMPFPASCVYGPCSFLCSVKFSILSRTCCLVVARAAKHASAMLALVILFICYSKH